MCTWFLLFLIKARQRRLGRENEQQPIDLMLDYGSIQERENRKKELIQKIMDNIDKITFSEYKTLVFQSNANLDIEEEINSNVKINRFEAKEEMKE